MRHRKAGIKINRTTSHRQAMFRNMVTSLFKHERIRTTDTKAKELRRWADSMITLAKRGDLHARRQALAIIREKAVVHKLFAEAPKRFAGINGGYTRVVKLTRRPGDAAPISLVELVTADADSRQKKPAKKAKAADKPAPDAGKAPVPDTADAGTDTPEPPVQETDSPVDAQEASEDVAPATEAAEEPPAEVENKETAASAPKMAEADAAAETDVVEEQEAADDDSAAPETDAPEK